MYRKILDQTKPSYKAKRDTKGKLFRTIANYGIKKGQIATRMHGQDYTGFSIKALEDIKPLLTDDRISRATKFISKGDIQSAIATLQLRDYVKRYGVNITYKVLTIWLEKNQIQVPQEYIAKSTKVKNVDDEMLNWITRRRSEPLSGKIKIMAIGKSKQGTIVPIEWLGKEFPNAHVLHKKMDKLEWRKGRPPVKYCCIYTMTIADSNKWRQITSFHKFSGGKTYQIGLLVRPKNNLLNCHVQLFNKMNAERWIDNLINDCDNYVYNVLRKENQKLIIVCDLNAIKRTSNLYHKTDNVGLLVSRLQKAIRRGRTCSKTLKDTIEKLSISPAYNLPEQQFVRVSGSRQLAWRLFITIIEDASPYKPQKHYFSLLDILSLALIAQLDPDIQFNEWIINKLLYTALLIQHNDDKGTNWSWRKGKIQKELWTSSISGSFSLALKFMPMMTNDYNMLQKGLGYLSKIKLHTLSSPEKDAINKLINFSEEESEKHCCLAAIDMHCVPNILIKLQASLPFIPYNKTHTTKGLGSFIWIFSSRINVRYSYKKIEDEEIKATLKSLHMIQQNDPVNKPYITFPKNRPVKLRVKKTNNNFVKRLSFLLIFGETIHFAKYKSQKAVEVIVAGTKEKPCKVKRNKKYLEGDERIDSENRYFDLMLKGKTIILPNPPNGYKWINQLNRKNRKIIIKVDKHKNFYVENIKLKPFDGSAVLTKLDYPQVYVLNNKLRSLIEHCLYIDSSNKTKLHEWQLLQNLLYLARDRYNRRHFTIYGWLKTAYKSKIPISVWKAVLVRLYDTVNGSVYIGPVDRRGNKLHVAINYMYEGTMLRILLMLSLLYPRVLKPASIFRFRLNTPYEEYQHLIECLEMLAFKNKTTKNNIKKIIIKTKLWDHQKRTSDDMTRGFTVIGKKGFGDASNVGAGKTLTALQVMANLLEHNRKNNLTNHKGFLVLMPSLQLYKTWTGEIQKHTKGFRILTQNANGSIQNMKKQLTDIITFNTILITSLGRIRNHPISNSWILVTIDECLSVQNRDALQTQEAWRQIVCAQFGVIMMSATFFKSRFDKLFYMLKMLRSGLPETKEYLDTILSEHIFCHIPKTMRKWITNINRYDLNIEQREKYAELQKLDIGSDKLYVTLSKYLYDNFDFIECFAKTINKLNKLDKPKKALIYSRSKREADELANKIESVSRYPDKTGTHCVVSYAEGTYGLNDLTDYNTIVIRLEGDISQIHQMKGRLDRNGQKDDILNLEYILLTNTIYEANIIKLDIGNSFYKNHILPLALFYDIAVGRK